jgi:GT2 family glycosyltransferase
VFRDHPRTGVAGPKIYYENPPNQIWYAGGSVSLARGIVKHIGIRQQDAGQFDSVREVDYVTGCALMAKREVFDKIGYLDPAYRAYFEDVDFCARAARAGYEIRYVPRGKVWHKISASTGGQLSCQKISRKFRSSLRFFGRYAAPYHWLVIPLFFVIDGARIGVLVLLGRIRGARYPTHLG